MQASQSEVPATESQVVLSAEGQMEVASESQVEKLASERLQHANGGTGTPSHLGEGRGGAWPTEYDGVTYANIIEAWLQQKGIYGGVAEGARNNMFYQLAMDLRYICNFKKEWLLQVMPTWELSLKERETTIQSALNRPQGRALPTALVTAIAKVHAVGDMGELDSQAISNEMRNPLPKKLPYILQLMAKRFPNNPHAMILCALPPLGALCTNFEAEYLDGEMEKPIFYCILTAPQASGKKVIRKIDGLIAFPIAEHDEMQREELREFKKLQRKMKNEKGNKQPQEPDLNIRKVPINISRRVLLERMFYAAGACMYSIGEEVDTLIQGMKSGAWAISTDMLRLCFDGGEFGQDYAAENSFNAVVKGRWNLLLSGTWGSVGRFFTNLEDGTMTRFMFAQLESSEGKPLLPKAKRGVDRVEEQIREEAQRLYEVGSLGSNVTLKMPYTTKALLQWQDLQIKLWELGGKTDTALDTLRRRSMLMGFRAALVAAATEHMHDSQIVADFAVWVAQEVLDQQMALFGKELNSVNRHEAQFKLQADSQMRKNSQLRLVGQLGDEFTQDDVCNLYVQKGYSAESAMKAIRRLLSQGMIEKVGDGHEKCYRVKR